MSQQRVAAESLFPLFPLLVFATAVARFAAFSSFATSDFPLDDSWIHRVYARSFAFGHGFAYNESLQEAGSTSPLWVVVTTPAHWLSALGGTPAVVFGVKAIGALLGGIVVWLSYRITRGLTGSAFAAMIAAAMLALEPRLLYATLSGMETLLLVALWIGATAFVLERRFRLSLVLIACMPLARPEAALIVPLALAGTAIGAGLAHPMWRRLSTWLVLVVPSSAWMGFCLSVNGHPLPNTFYRKASSLAIGSQQLDAAWAAFTQHGFASQPFLWLGLVAFVILIARRESEEAWFSGSMLLLAPAIYGIGIVGTRAYSLDGFYWTRWTDPAVIVATTALVIGLAVLLCAGVRNPRLGIQPVLRDLRDWPKSAWVVAGITAAAMLWSVPQLASSFEERRIRLSSDSRSIRLLNVEPALWMRDNTLEGETVGVHDAGAMRFFSERHTVDLAGLNYADIAVGRVDYRQKALELDWILGFPGWLDDSGLLAHFRPEHSFRMPPSEYTICRCPGQAVVVIAKRAPPSAGEDDALDPGSVRTFRRDREFDWVVARSLE